MAIAMGKESWWLRIMDKEKRRVLLFLLGRQVETQSGIQAMFFPMSLDFGPAQIVQLADDFHV